MIRSASARLWPPITMASLRRSGTLHLREAFDRSVVGGFGCSLSLGAGRLARNDRTTERPNNRTCSAAFQVPELPEGPLVPPPGLAQPDPELEVHAPAQERLDLQAGPLADPLQHLPAGADDDPLLG